MGGSISGKVSTQSSANSLQKLNLILISVKENTKTFFDLGSEEFTIAGVEPGKYVLILLSQQNSPQPIFSANFCFRYAIGRSLQG
jgi:hypothetical protein